MHKAIGEGVINACHDCSDGGLGVALAEMALAGRTGALINLDAVPVTEEMNATEVLYSESASRLVVSVPEDKVEAFEAIFDGQTYGCLGEVTGDEQFIVASGATVLVADNCESLAKSFKGTLKF